MGNWIDKAIELLQRSLYPVAQELNEIDWKSGLSDKSDRLAANNVSMASIIISETIGAGFMKPSDPESSSKKFASYVPFWACFLFH